MLPLNNSFDYWHIKRYSELKLPFLLYLLPRGNALIFYRISTAWCGAINNPKIRHIFYNYCSIPYIIHGILAILLLVSCAVYGLLFPQTIDVKIMTGITFAYVISLYLIYSLLIAISIVLTKKLLVFKSTKHCLDFEQLPTNLLEEYRTRFLYSITRNYFVIYFSFYKPVDVINIFSDYKNGYLLDHEYQTILTTIKSNKVSDYGTRRYYRHSWDPETFLRYLPFYNNPLHGYHSLILFLLCSEKLLQFKLIDKIGFKVYFSAIFTSFCCSIPYLFFMLIMSFLAFLTFSADNKLFGIVEAVFCLGFTLSFILSSGIYYFISKRATKKLREKIKNKFDLVDDKWDAFLFNDVEFIKKVNDDYYDESL
ncbi:hypothetical protein [Mycoplasma sp. E35C]|uniref:hypothetical protein n=1 Tax=Mycoplasma sp. E35C TaxID=2801918 RepID=UPI001CA40FCA|nr:hypothetical protein [Mycoplasma sp. E35C]QZX48853.1 hypothetical protein JJE79_02210 [Mycoplasma sp. E35C]